MNSGREGLELIGNRKPDLILCDIAMPQMDGYEFLEAVRKNYTLTSTPFIFLTAYSERTDIQKGLRLGATAYVVKPFDADELIHLVQQHLP
jgi:CheY-like chemotaxis protein